MKKIVFEGVSKEFPLVSIPKTYSLKAALVQGGLFQFGKPTRRRRVLEDISFSIEEGSSVGIIGRNGSGKTTLLRLISQIYQPDKGRISISGDVTLLSLGLGFHEDFSGHENLRLNCLALGFTPRQIEEKYDEIVDFAGLVDFMDAPVRTYSSGMRSRLAFSIAISNEPDILLLDEVLAVGDEAFSAKCYGRVRRLREAGKTLVLVSHSTQQIQAWCDRAIWIERGVKCIDGPVATVLQAYQADLEATSVDVSLTI
jgi:lipopolysaccharide transport system ATP-binding protein